MDTQFVSLSGTLLYTAFVLLIIAIIPIAMSMKTEKKRAWNIGFTMVIVSFILMLGYIVFRWIGQGHAPVSNMYEFIVVFAIMIIGGLIITYFYFKTRTLALFAIPIVLLLIAYGSMFTREASPLIPALQSNWLFIHVFTVTFAYGILSMSAVAGLIYLLKVIEPKEKTKRAFALESLMAGIVIVISFILMTVVMNGIVGYQDDYYYVDQQGNTQIAEYNLPALVVFRDAIPVEHVGENNYEPTEHMFTGVELPPIINSQSLNTVIWSFIVGLIVYGLVRLIIRQRIITLIKPLTRRANLELLDEIGYRSVIIGFPLFALGGIFFAAIWAQIAWSRFWGWDPKETFAFITFMFYTIFLHLRLNRGYEGEKSAWLAILGFLLILFNLIAINLLVAGLHSYA